MNISALTDKLSDFFPEDKLKVNPKDLVEELDKYIIGQDEAKKSVAVAVRNRWRRSKIEKELAEEIKPRNILMIGPTGVGKTEIARRVAKIMDFPFKKVNATDYTTRGYHGLDVDHIIHNLMEDSIQKVRNIFEKKYKSQSEKNANDKIKELLTLKFAEDNEEFNEEKFKNNLYEEIEIEVECSSNQESYSSFDLIGGETKIGILNISDMLSKAIEDTGLKSKKTKRHSVKDARIVLINEENNKCINDEQINKYAIELLEKYGVVFIDEIDKIVERKDFKTDVNREGVQRDLLPLIEGTSIQTKYGPVNTDHVLFIAAGAFHLAKYNDLLPELQGRFPIKINLDPLSEGDFIKILCNVKYNLPEQQRALFKTEDVELTFEQGAITEIASIAAYLNKEIDNIGARRLHDVMERIIEEISFICCNNSDKNFVISMEYVQERMKDRMKNFDISKFIL